MTDWQDTNKGKWGSWESKSLEENCKERREEGEFGQPVVSEMYLSVGLI